MEPVMRVENAAELRAKFRGVSRTIQKQVKVANKDAADVVAQKARTKAETPQQHRNKNRIAAGATIREGYVRISNTNSNPYAVASFMGTKRRTGWYGRPQYDGSPAPQFLPWVGNQHDEGDAGGIHTYGYPYAISDAIEQTLDSDVREIYERGMKAAFARYDFEMTDNASMF